MDSFLLCDYEKADLDGLWRVGIVFAQSTDNNKNSQKTEEIRCNKRTLCLQM